MIYLIHEHNKVLEVIDNEFKSLAVAFNEPISKTLFSLAQTYPDELIVWCRKDYKKFINKEAIKSIFHHDRILASYSVGENNFIPEGIGYVDQSIYIKVNRKVTYPTWLMSSDIGGIHAKVLNVVLLDIKKDNNFDYFINSLAKIAMPQGLFCYSEPKLLLKESSSAVSRQASKSQLFKFVKQHYKLVWVFFLFLCFIIYEKKFPFFPFLNSLLYKKRKNTLDFNQIDIKSSRKLVSKKEVDVIIPTLGRKKYLLDVLKDFSKQTILPKNIIIVEQNPEPNSKSDLDYLTNTKWPFKVKHIFIHQTGACNARNVALSHVKSEWVILGDDDNRFNVNLIEDLFGSIDKYGIKSISTVYLQPNEKQTYNITGQTTIFGSGNSILRSDLLNKVKFDMAYEFGYGEDRDYGMQIRNIGEDVLFESNISITHLKAPIGGFRTKMVQKWDNEKIQPKPSPTVSLFNLKYVTKQQLLAYKTSLFINYYQSQSIKNPIKYFKLFKLQWNSSLYWAKQLLNA